MSDFATLEAAFAQIRERDGRYHERGYLFVLAALAATCPAGSSPGRAATSRSSSSDCSR